MQIETLALAGLRVLTPQKHSDARGHFSETWNRATLRDLGIDLDFVQDNHSWSARRGTLRGLHAQRPPHAQTKLIRCTRGAIFDVAVDMRAGSLTYGHWTGVELSAENGQQLLVPSGFLHGFITLTDGAEVAYKCTHRYEPTAAVTVRWDDPGIAVLWPECVTEISQTDAHAPPLREVVRAFSAQVIS